MNSPDGSNKHPHPNQKRYNEVSRKVELHEIIQITTIVEGGGGGHKPRSVPCQKLTIHVCKQKNSLYLKINWCINVSHN